MRPFSLALLLFLLTSCSDDAAEIPSEVVRGRVVGTAFGGEALVVDHEEIPGFMPAMRMSLRLEDDLQAPPESAKIAFRLRRPETGALYIDSLGLLPDSVVLQLAPPDTSLQSLRPNAETAHSPEE